MSETTTPEQPEVTKTATCPSLSNTATLTYEVGTTDKDTFFRVSGNSAAGLFSKDWIPLAQITPLLTNSTITSGTLKELYEGRSKNSPGFLLAILKAEGLVRQVEGKSFHYTATTTAPEKKAKKKGKGDEEC
ncbi:hypothetical protein JZU71_00505 [bacterium]|nr:hypothetical protein [bacterium]